MIQIKLVQTVFNDSCSVILGHTLLIEKLKEKENGLIFHSNIFFFGYKVSLVYVLSVGTSMGNRICLDGRIWRGKDDLLFLL